MQIKTTMKIRHTSNCCGSPAIEFASIQAKCMYACENSMTTTVSTVRRAAMEQSDSTAESVSELRYHQLEFVHYYAL